MPGLDAIYAPKRIALLSLAAHDAKRTEGPFAAEVGAGPAARRAAQGPLDVSDDFVQGICQSFQPASQIHEVPYRKVVQPSFEPTPATDPSVHDSSFGRSDSIWRILSASARTAIPITKSEATSPLRLNLKSSSACTPARCAFRATSSPGRTTASTSATDAL